MNDDEDLAVLAAYRAAAGEEPAPATDARVVAAARAPRPASDITPAVVWAQAAAVALMVSAVTVSALRPPPDPRSDPRYFGLYEGREASVLLALGPTASAPGAVLMNARREPADPATPSKEKTDG